MKPRGIIVLTTLFAVMIRVRSAAAGETERYPTIAYAAPAEQSLISVHATANRTDYVTEASLFSSAATTVRAEGSLIAVWRERVFASLAANMTPDATDGDRVVQRTAVRESTKMALEQFPALDRLVKSLKFEVSTDMFSKSGEKDGRDELPSLPAVPAKLQPVHQDVKDRFFMKTGLRIPVEQGRPVLLSETNAVYGSFTSYVSVRVDGKFDSRIGLRYIVGPVMQVNLERATADAQDPALGGAVRKSASNTLKLICLF